MAVSLPPEGLAAAQKLLLLLGACSLSAACLGWKGWPLVSPLTLKVTCSKSVISENFIVYRSGVF